jgi:hypothetical protein
MPARSPGSRLDAPSVKLLEQGKVAVCAPWRRSVRNFVEQLEDIVAPDAADRTVSPAREEFAPEITILPLPLPFLLWRISHGLRATMKAKTFRDIFCEHF